VSRLFIGSVLVRIHAQRENLPWVVDRVRFEKHHSKRQRGFAIEISYPCCFVPNESAIPGRACRSSDHSPHVIDTERSTGASTGEHPQILHPTCLSPQKSAHPPWTFRVPNDIPVVVDCASLAGRISR